MPDPLTLDMFSERVGQDFRVETDAARFAFVLESATGFGDSGRIAAGFSLVFLGPAEPLLPQGTYRVVHDELGDTDIFIVPIGCDESGARYEAIFA